MGILSALFKRKRKAPETRQEAFDRVNRDFRKRIEREDKMPVLEDGTPNSHWYILEANRLRDLDRDDQAEAILAEGYELCRRAGLGAAAAQIKTKMRDQNKLE